MTQRTENNGQAYARVNYKHQVIVSIERWGELKGVALLNLTDAEALLTELKDAIADIKRDAINASSV
jgi:hypothetical protein